MYEDKKGVAQDYYKARELFQKAADAGNFSAMEDFGLLWENSNGGGQNYGKARKWYQKAADAGNADAIVCLGRVVPARQGSRPGLRQSPGVVSKSSWRRARCREEAFAHLRPE